MSFQSGPTLAAEKKGSRILSVRERMIFLRSLAPLLSGPISRDIAILSLRYPISRDTFKVFKGGLQLPQLVRHPPLVVRPYFATYHAIIVRWHIISHKNKHNIVLRWLSRDIRRGCSQSEFQVTNFFLAVKTVVKFSVTNVKPIFPAEN